MTTTISDYLQNRTECFTKTVLHVHIQARVLVRSWFWFVQNSDSRDWPKKLTNETTGKGSWIFRIQRFFFASLRWNKHKNPRHLFDHWLRNTAHKPRLENLKAPANWDLLVFQYYYTWSTRTLVATINKVSVSKFQTPLLQYCWREYSLHLRNNLLRPWKGARIPAW